MLTVVLAAAVVLSSLTACSPTATVGQVLTDLQAKLDGILAASQNAANVELQQAVAAAQTVLDSAKSDMVDVLDTATKDVNQTVQHSLDQLTTMVGDILQKTSDLLTQATMQGQQILNSLPFINKNPQVTSYGPLFVSPQQLGGHSVPLTVTGNFVHAFEIGMHPTLSYSSASASAPVSVPAATLTSQVLSFDVPKAVFGQPTDALRRITVTLTAPYDSGKVFPSVKPGEFSLGMFVLPVSPVKQLSLDDTRTQTTNSRPPSLEVNQQTAPVGTSWHVESYDCKDKDELEPTIVASNVPGSNARFMIDTNPAAFQIHASDPRGNGNYDVHVVNVTPNSFQVEIKTRANCFAGISTKSGDVYASVTYRETYQPPTLPPITTPIPLHYDLTGFQWGQEISPDVYSDNWHVNAVLFDGTSLQLGATDTSTNRYLRVRYLQAAHQVEIFSPSADDLKNVAS